MPASRRDYGLETVLSIRDAFAALGPAAVLTVHRSQGSSFGDVFVAQMFFERSADPPATLLRGCLPRANRGLDDRGVVVC